MVSVELLPRPSATPSQRGTWITDQVRNENFRYAYYRAIVLTTGRPFDPSTGSGLRDLIWGAAAGIGRGVESTGVFGWVTGDRLRRVWFILITKR